MTLAFPKLPFELIDNPGADPSAAYGDRQAAVLNAEGLAEARRCITAWPGYAPTPLVELAGLARELGIARLSYKQEGARFGLKSFKPLGGAFAVERCLIRAVAEATGEADVDPARILDGTHADIVSRVTVTAATDGNHGRSVAWGSRMFGCRCVIFINEAVSAARENAIADLGAEVRRLKGSYDDAVRHAFKTAREEGWTVIPDTSDSDIVTAPRDVMQGYALLADELFEQLDAAPTHLFLQAGVGGMAAAVAAEFWRRSDAARPMTILVEPKQAACWFKSLEAGEPTSVTGDIDSFMGGLSCGECSALAWEILRPGAHAAMIVDDEAAKETMRLLANGVAGDPPVVGGESGVAGLAALITAATDPGAREKLKLDEESRVVVIGSEGAVDEAVFRDVVGRASDEVAA
ncbi:diaminopropionate ammonia-lyase [Rhodobium orientis]|uniref:Diaminopropionate ammonia-lyase n=1 Tax=Rhodobium orientis TaxID=34017 RepID=A0A327JMC7_9HYPH|nr:diaminopropionate ammonia-lyase [Rhodobium orientis]MBB4304720.1 diaminopropionate ammonia-lyase [Rhodobium orientis]MBK5952076.1 diaminopropionate ammonia-lyase [Rhodobium orientis]RAI26523.1 diaminopropionate ammonia-lyase [Rhodobium orientis]